MGWRDKVATSQYFSMSDSSPLVCFQSRKLDSATVCIYHGVDFVVLARTCWTYVFEIKQSQQNIREQAGDDIREWLKLCHPAENLRNYAIY